jgi:hypothetical protein
MNILTTAGDAAADPVVTTHRVAPQTMLAISIAEGKRLLRHPVLLAGAALGAVLSIQPWLGGEPAQDWETLNYLTFLLGWAPLYLAAFLVANMAALRERETTTAEMFRSYPTRYAGRTLALLAAGLVPTGLATALAAIQLSVIAQAGGIAVGDQLVPLTPTVVEMAWVPTTTAAAFASGVAVARAVRSLAFSAIIAAVTTFIFFIMFWAVSWFPVYFVTPYATSLRALDLGEHLTGDELTKTGVLSGPSYDTGSDHWSVVVRDIATVGWHNVYLIGLALLLAAYALRRSGRDPRVRWLLLAGTVFAIGGLTMHMATLGGPFVWWELVHGLEVF